MARPSQRYHVSHGTTGIGHLYQGRYKSFPVQDDRHYLTVMRYIEANPLRAEIVDNPTNNYSWSSFAARRGIEKPFSLSDGPVVLPANWPQLVSRDIASKDQDKISNSINRGTPLGEYDWIKRTAAKLNLDSTLRPRGRPKYRTPLIRPLNLALKSRRTDQCQLHRADRNGSPPCPTVNGSIIRCTTSRLIDVSIWNSDTGMRISSSGDCLLKIK